jgi:hypothetical protein
MSSNFPRAISDSLGCVIPMRAAASLCFRPVSAIDFLDPNGKLGLDHEGEVEPDLVEH